MIPRWLGGYLPTPSADPVYLYTDNVVQIIAERHLNNGQPSGHAMWIASASIKPGEHVVHVGTGTGYYTAIMSHLPGTSGKVTGIELTGSRDGCSRSIMMAHGLPVGVLHQIVQDGFATENRETANVGTGPIIVTMLQITAEGRLALAGK